MRKIIVCEFVSLDGVMEEPGWTFAYWNDEIAKFKYDELFLGDTSLLGRVTYEGFAEAWPDSEEKEFADRINGMPKYVVTNTLEKADWQNSHIIRGDVEAEIKKLKAQEGGNILVSGSATLVNWLAQHNLVDEYRLLVYPVVLGQGKRLFQEGVQAQLKLVEIIPFSSGPVAMIYQAEC